MRALQRSAKERLGRCLSRRLCVRPTGLGSSVELHYFLLAWLPDGGLEKRILGGANRPILKTRRVDGIRQLHRQAEPAIQLLDFFQEGFRPCRAATQGNAL